MLKAPIVSTAISELSEESREVIQAINPAQVIIVGGEPTIEPAVVSQLQSAVPGVNVTRLSGATRFETNQAVYEYGLSAAQAAWSRTAVVSSGDSFADSLSIASFAYAKQVPLFLADPVSGLRGQAFASITSGAFDNVIIVGGTPSVSAATEAQLRGAGLNVTRCGGETRYETSVIIAQYAMANNTSSGTLGIASPGFATGDNFPDALCAGPLMGSCDSIIMLVANTDSGRSSLSSVFQPNAGGISNAYFCGSTASIAADLRANITAACGL